jgi:hypothetical protein
MVEEDKPLTKIYYIREPGGELVARYWTAGENEYTQFYHFDALGSTRLITDINGDVSDTYEYDAWGKQIDHTGNTGQPFRFVGQLGYYTHYADSNLFTEGGFQLLLVGFSFYDVDTARVTQAAGAAAGGKVIPDLSRPPVKGIPKEPSRILPAIGRAGLAILTSPAAWTAVLLWAIEGTAGEADECDNMCDELRRSLPKRLSTLMEHVTGSDNSGKPHLHRSYCEQLARFLAGFARECIMPGDRSPDSAFCKLLCAWRKYCGGRDWPRPPESGRPPQPPLSDAGFAGLYGVCKCN